MANDIPSAGSSSSTGNGEPTVDAGTDIVMPARTPFFLGSVGSDPNSDPLTYTVEQRDGGTSSSGRTLNNPDATAGPLFRSFPPTTRRHWASRSSRRSSLTSSTVRLMIHTGDFTAGSGFFDISDANVATTNQQHVAFDPARLLDTRPDSETTIDAQFWKIGTRNADTTTELTVTNRAGVPADATAIVINVTVVSPQAPGHITKIGDNGKICIYTHAAPTSSSTPTATSPPDPARAPPSAARPAPQPRPVAPHRNPAPGFV